MRRPAYNTCLQWDIWKQKQSKIYLTMGRWGSKADVIMLLMPALHDTRADRASSLGKCEPKECRGFWFHRGTTHLWKCQCVNTLKGYASSVICMLADADKHMICTGRESYAPTKCTEAHNPPAYQQRTTHRLRLWMTFCLIIIFE